MSGNLARAISSRLHRTTTIRTKRAKALTAAAALAVQVGIIGVVATSTPASAASGTDSGVGVGYTLEGCRNNGTIALPNSDHRVLCPDSAYTTGNLGKGWNELDLVPIRVTLSAGTSAPSTQTLRFAIAVDNCSTNDGATGCASGRHGYDVLGSDAADGTPVFNSLKSSGTCGVVSATAQQYVSGSNVGDPTSLYRIVTVTGIGTNSTCVYDAYGRLALGSHLYPGSSLHFNLFNSALAAAGVGQKEVSIPVKEILPQSISKNMSANQGANYLWGVSKSGPANVTLGDSCASGFSSGSATITVTWTRTQGAAGKINITTTVSATNPAARTIHVAITDNVYLNKDGTGTSVATLTGSADVGANSTVPIINAQTVSVDGSSSDGYVSDVATGTYTDLLTGVPVPGTTSTSAYALIGSGTDTNDTATITDDEYWKTTDSGLSFSVASPSNGSFVSNDGGVTPAYVVGDHVSGTTHVYWSSGTVSASGSVTFTKTLYGVTAHVGSATLTDTATVTSSGSVVTNSDPLDIPVSESATVSLGVSKSTTLQIASAQTFTFHLFDSSTSPATDLSKTVTVTVPANSNGPVSSTTNATGLSPDGTYYFHEDALAPYGAQDSSTVGFTLVAGDTSSCTQLIPVTNASLPATAQVRKVTNPTSSGLWTFTLTGPNGLSETITNVEANALVGGNPKYFAFSSSLDVDGGTYTITETPQTNYDLTSVSGDINGNTARVNTSVSSETCSFVLNLTTDDGGVFECTFTNTQEGTIIVKKITDPTSAADTFDFTGDASGTIGNGGTITVNHLVPGTYTSTETTKTDWDLKSITCDDGSSTTPSSGSLATRTATFKLDPGETVTCTFSNTERGTIIVKKVTDPTTATDTFGFTGDASGTIGNGGTISVGSLVPGTYTSVEGTKTGWDLTSVTCDDGSSATASSGSVATRTATFKLDPGETVTCTFTNRERGHAKVIKTVSGAAPSGSQSFVFQLRSGASATQAGTILESLTANAANGGVIPFTTDLVPGDTYQMCEQMQPGWDNNFASSYSVYNPSGDNSVICTDFTVTPGELKVFNVDNTLKGGMALTIGFWKNWASCAGSNGKQKPVLDQTLLAAAQAGHPITIGTLVLDPNVLGAATACKDAVNLLNKTTIDGKTKKASDPLFNMAAQLLAAELNVAAGAGACSGATSAINAAQALLVKYNFNGQTYSPKLTAADATLANSLATTLDQYNNNLLC